VEGRKGKIEIEKERKKESEKERKSERNRIAREVCVHKGREGERERKR